ncbi:MAG: hypothetical protein ACM3P0_03990 [Acidobacteriota bacterium]
MKRFISIVLILLSTFCLNSCSKENTVEPDRQSSKALGSVSFRIDKVNAPSDVTLVKAYLSRPDCDTLKKDLNLYADPSTPSADILFENIKTGSWHLRITAENASGEILFSGETDIMIEDSKTTEVSLTLTPKPTGMGSIYVSVKWGTALRWTEYFRNPIFAYENSPANPLGGVSGGKVIYENGKYKMWYSNTYQSALVDIGYAESNDGLTWTSPLSEPVLKPGTDGQWDAYSVAVSAVFKDNEMYKMFYTGIKSYGMPAAVGMAISQDGIHWQKMAQPVLTMIQGETAIGATAIVKKGGVYYLYFHTYPDWRIHLATSQDGNSWYRYSEDPIMDATQSWEGGVGYASIVYDGSQFKMVYNNYYRNALGIAVSSDGIHWTKDSNNPVFQLSDTKNGWTSQINYPFFFKNGDQQRIYYTGTSNGRNNIAVASYQ